MFRISNKLSIRLSLVISGVFFLLCILLAIRMPALAKILTGIAIEGREPIPPAGQTFVLVMAYLLLAVFLLADGLLFSLLRRVAAGRVFSPACVSRIRGISWCCFLACAVCCGLGIYFRLAFFAAFLVAFLGLCLRVTKNVIAEATAIKNENDLTV